MRSKRQSKPAALASCCIEGASPATRTDIRFFARAVAETNRDLIALIAADPGNALPQENLHIMVASTGGRE
jgi:hypothetical protein